MSKKKQKLLLENNNKMNTLTQHEAHNLFTGPVFITNEAYSTIMKLTLLTFFFSNLTPFLVIL